MDIRDCLTVIQGLIQISSTNLEQDYFRMVDSNLKNADKKLNKLIALAQVSIFHHENRPKNIFSSRYYWACGVKIVKNCKSSDLKKLPWK